jgi:hypothetical protein
VWAVSFKRAIYLPCYDNQHRYELACMSTAVPVRAPACTFLLAYISIYLSPCGHLGLALGFGYLDSHCRSGETKRASEEEEDEKEMEDEKEKEDRTWCEPGFGPRSTVTPAQSHPGFTSPWSGVALKHLFLSSP